MASERFIKFKPSEEADWLLANYPFAYLLLNLVAIRARRTPNDPGGLQIGEAHIGDYSAIGASRQQYRTALQVLCSKNYLTICETNRTRKKSTNGTTNGTTTTGTKVKLLNSIIWDINLEFANHSSNHRSNHCPTTAQPLPNHEQEREEGKEREEERKKIKKEKPPAFPKIAYREFVALTEKEFFSLVERNGKEFVEAMLDKLNSYKGSTGKKYISDFDVMNKGGWLHDKITEVNSNGQNPKRSSSAGVNNTAAEPRFKAAKVLSIKEGG